jgi:HK97 gp10 family phage protein
VPREFSSIEALMAQIAKDVIRMEVLSTEALRKSGELIQKAAQHKIGEYQAASGPFAAWEPLTESTVDDRKRRNYTPNDPLLRSGELQRSIVIEAGVNKVLIGVKSAPTEDGKADIGDIAVYQELGTATIPPRPFLGPALHENRKEAIELFKIALVEAFQH